MSSIYYPVTMTLFSFILSWCLFVMTIGILLPLKASGNELESNKTSYFSKRPSDDNCTSGSLEELEERAGIIFTGTVRGVYPHRKHLGQTKADVEVKRLVKGSLVGKVNTRYMLGSLRNIVIVNGLNNPEICHSSANPSDTRIFLVNANGSELKLNSSLIRLKLSYLERIEAAVKNDVFIEKPEDPEDPCTTEFCPFHAQCTINASTGGAHCSCQKSCHDVFSPVCGSDDITYTSECHLAMASCHQQKRIQVRRPGSCRDPDLCADVQCTFGAVCVLSFDGTGAICQCPDACSSHKNFPICGNDGKDYGNLCEMERASCMQMKGIRQKYEGKCDPCQGFNCTSGVCRLNADREPVCECGDSVCGSTDDSSFICASDGQTYDNECAMKKKACISQKKIFKMQGGKCNPDSNPCLGLKIRPHAECQVSNGRPEYVCPGSCESTFRPVCGNDRKTYDNECQLRRQSCISDIPVAVTNDGSCSLQNAGSQSQYSNGKICSWINGQQSCVCPPCAPDFEPVCGSNGISYSSECMLKAESCQKDENIFLQHKGLCSTCKKKCDFYAECQLDIRSVSQCICPTFCVEVKNQVCGTDGVTYTNQCELRIASCSLGKPIAIASKGSCGSCANSKCRRGAKCENGRCVCSYLCPDTKASVCASNGVTYDNECRMREAGCKLALDLEAVQSGECDDLAGSGSGTGDYLGCEESTCQFGGVCTVDSSGFSECKCNFSCPALRQTVCGSDGRTYGSECLMREMSCVMKKEITAQSADNCDGILEEMCEGTAPLIDPRTMREYNCTDDVGICPAGSYCHNMTGFAKCCQEETPISSCQDTAFGCCADNTTVAPGPRQTGCPGFCRCNPLGSLSTTCDPISRQCTCKPGVVGLRCDRCHPDHWHLPTTRQGTIDCLPCHCSPVGSLRDDCDKQTGRCLCHQGFAGLKCDRCIDGKPIGPHGCPNKSNGTLSSCASVSCARGAACQMRDAVPQCICRHKGLNSSLLPVCGSDNQTYGSPCQLESFACRMQQSVAVAFKGHCSSGKVDESAGEKKEDIGSIGDPCVVHTDCLLANSICYFGLCLCNTGFTPSDSRPFCRMETTIEPLFTKTRRRAVREAFDIRLPSTSLQIEHTNLPPISFTTTTSNSKTALTTTTTGYLFTNASAKTSKLTTPSNSPVEVPSKEIQAAPNGASFMERSFLQLQWSINGNPNMSVEVAFIPQSLDGIIFYTGQVDNPRGDFVSLTLRDGFVEFRFELGSGSAVLKSAKRVTMNQMNRVLGQRSSKEGSLKLNNFTTVFGTSKGNLAMLNLKRSPIYLGSVRATKDVLLKQTRMEIGFVGCVTSLRVSESRKVFKLYDLTYPGSPDVIQGSLSERHCSSFLKLDQSLCKSYPCESQGAQMTPKDSG